MFKIALSCGFKRNLKFSSDLISGSKICGVKKLYCTRQRKNGFPMESCLKCKRIIKYIYGNHAPPTWATETKHKNKLLVAKCPKCNRTIMFSRKNLYNYDLTRQTVVNEVRSPAVEINANKTRLTKIKELNEKIGENVMLKNIFGARKNSFSENKKRDDKIKITTKQQNSKQSVTQNYAIVNTSNISDGDGTKIHGDNLIDIQPKGNTETKPIIKNDTPNEKSYNVIVKNIYPSAVTNNSLSYGLGNNNDEFKTGSTEYQQLDIPNKEVKGFLKPEVSSIGLASYEKLPDNVIGTRAQVPDANLRDESLWKLSNKESTSLERNREINETISNSDEARIEDVHLCLPFHVTSLISYTNDNSHKSKESTEMNPNEAFSPQIDQKIFYTVENKTTDREDTNVIYKLEYPNAVTNNCLSYGLTNVDDELETTVPTVNKPITISSNDVKESKAHEINFTNPTTPKTVTQRVMVTRAQVSKANNLDEESLRKLKKKESESRPLTPMKVCQTHRHNKVAIKTPDKSKSKITNLTFIDRSKSLGKTTPNVTSKAFGYTYSKGDKIRTKNNKTEISRDRGFYTDNDIDGNSYVTYLKTKSGKTQSISKPKETYEAVKSKQCNLENDLTKKYEVFLPDVAKKVDINVKSKKSNLPGLPITNNKWDQTVKGKELDKIITIIFNNPKSLQIKSKEIDKAISNIGKPIQDNLPTRKSKDEEFIKLRQIIEMLRSKNKDITQTEDMNSSKEFKNLNSTNSQSNKLLSDTKAIIMKPNQEEASNKKLGVRFNPLPTPKTIENRLDHLINEKYTIELPKNDSKINLNVEKYWSKTYAKQKTRGSKAKDVKTKTSLVLFKPHTQKHHPIYNKSRLSSLDNISKYSKRWKNCKKGRINDAELQTIGSELISENKKLSVSRHEAENKYTKEIVFKDKTSPIINTPTIYRAKNKQLMKSKMQTKSQHSEMENKIENYLVINQRAGSDSYKSPATKENYANINQSAQSHPIKIPEIIGKDTCIPNFVYENTLNNNTQTPLTNFVEKERAVVANNQNLTSSEKESTGENVTNINQSSIVAEKERMNEEFANMNKSVQGTVHKSPAFEEGEFYGNINSNIQNYTYPSTPTVEEQNTDEYFANMNQSIHTNLCKFSNTIEYESKGDDFAIMNQSVHSNMFQNTLTIGIESSATKKENVQDSKVKKDVKDSTHCKPLKMQSSENVNEVKEAHFDKIMSAVHCQDDGKDIYRNNKPVIRHENLQIKSHSKPERLSKYEVKERSKENITIDKRTQRSIIKDQASAALASLEQDFITILKRDTEKKSLEQSSKSRSPQMPSELSRELPLSELLKQARKFSKQKAFESFKVTGDSKMEGTVYRNLNKYESKSESTLPNEKISEVGPHASTNVLVASSTIGKNEKLEASITPESEISLNALRKKIQARNLLEVFKNINDNKLEIESKIDSSSSSFPKAMNKFEKPGQLETTVDAVVNKEKPKAGSKTLYRKPFYASQDQQNFLKQKNTESAPMPKPNEYTVTIFSTLGDTKVQRINVTPREFHTTSSNPLKRDPQFQIASTSNTSKVHSSVEMDTDSTPYVSTQKSNATDSKNNKDMFSSYQIKTEKSIERLEPKPTVVNPNKSTEPKSTDQLTGSGAMMVYPKRGTPKHHRRKNSRRRVKPLHHLKTSSYRPVIGTSDSKNSSRYSNKHNNPSDKKDI